MKNLRKADILRKLEALAAEMSDPIYEKDKHAFTQSSYSRWAASELIKAVKDSDADSESVMVSFIQKMDWYAKDHYMFSVAYDISMYMYDQIFV